MKSIIWCLMKIAVKMMLCSFFPCFTETQRTHGYLQPTELSTSEGKPFYQNRIYAQQQHAQQLEVRFPCPQFFYDVGVSVAAVIDYKFANVRFF